MINEYQPRVIDHTLDHLMTDISAIAIEGAKGVGKTATASRRSTTILKMNDPAVRSRFAGNLNLLATQKPPIFIDEWQLEPEIWEYVRRSVDDGAKPGSYLLAGSAFTQAQQRIHSGAGRILRLKMWPMSLYERQIAPTTVSLRALLQDSSTNTSKNKLTPIEGNCNLCDVDYLKHVLRSGFPGLQHLSDEARSWQLESYIERIVDVDLPFAGLTVRKPQELLRWLRAYGAASSSVTNYNKILDAATPGEPNKPNRTTIETYREHLMRLHLLEPIPAWLPGFTPLKTLAKTPKHHLVDPALAAALEGVEFDAIVLGRAGTAYDALITNTKGDCLPGGAASWAGALFESLAAQSVRVYAQNNRAKLYHLRTARGEHEVDLIVEKANGNVVAFEVKLANHVTDEDCQHLRWLSKQIGPRLLDSAILYAGADAYRRPDGIAAIPLALLGP